jgi:DeoR family transcriptional regulator, fructose operon transcriptional repressor
MFAPERLTRIRKLVRQHRRMTFAEVQKHIMVSPATLRRDLSELEQTGDLIRVHGGILDPAYARSEVSFDERVMRQRAAKLAIAQAASALVPPGATVLVDAGSTCLEAGRALLGRNDVKLITHSVALLQAALLGEAEVICLGGELRKVSGALTGGAALGAVGAVHADIAFLGASGLELDGGISTTDLSETEMKRALLARAGRTILLADLSKWRSPSTVRFAAWRELDDWITDELPPRAELSTLKKSGVRVHRAARA